MCIGKYQCGNVKTKKGVRPKTKLQQECLRLRPKLDRCWRSKIREARDLFTVHGWYHRKRGLVWCEACGKVHRQEFPEMGVKICLNDGEYICPHCGEHLMVSETTMWSKLPRWDSMNYAYVTNIEGWTVVRNFYVERKAQMGQRPVYDVHEVWQRWLSEKGREVILTKTYHRSPYYFRWDFNSDWKVGRHNCNCSGYYVSSDVYDIYALDFGPIDVAPILKRNGWRDELADIRMDMFEVWKKLLTEPMAEELVKTGQEQVLWYWLKNEKTKEFIRSYMPSVRICTRNYYKINDATMWFDHLKLLEHFGKDLHNRKYVCPASLEKEHTKYIRRKQREEREKEIAEQIGNIKKNEPKYKKARGMYFGVCFGDESIQVVVLSSVREFFDEGMAMQHCVFDNRYYDEDEHPYSLILSARDNLGNRLETIEVDMKRWEIVQSRGYQNQPTLAHDAIVKLVNENMNVLKQIA